MNLKNSITSYIDEQQRCMTLLKSNSDKINDICNQLLNARNKRKNIFVFGNGGSGSTASHFVSDLLKTAIVKKEKRFKAISLTDNVPVILAWSNDVSYDDVFIEQLKNHFSKGDILIGFSGSGNSKNIIKSLKFGKENNAYCIGFTGKSGGKMNKFCDICLKVPSQDMLTIESQHVMICHCIISIIRNLGKPLFTYG
jgi:D-sedoheptulose 7-phosphate isomerase